MTIATGDCTDGVRTGLAGRIANKIVAQDGSVSFVAGTEHTKGLNAMADGIVDALNTDKVDTATQTSGGGGGGSTTTLHDVLGRIYKWWGIGASNLGLFTGVLVNGPQSFGAGALSVSTTLSRYFMLIAVNGGVNTSLGMWWGGSNGWVARQSLPKTTSRVKLLSTTNIANVVALCGTSGSSQTYNNIYTPTLGGTNADTAVHVSIAADSRVGAGNFVFGTGDGTTANWIDTGVAYNTTDEWLLCIDMTTAGTAKCTITNCTSLAVTTVSLTTHLPGATTALGPEVLSWNNQAGAQNAMLCEYIYMDHAA